MDLFLMYSKTFQLLSIFLILAGSLTMIFRSVTLRLPVLSTRNYNERHVSDALLADNTVSDCFVSKEYEPVFIEWQFADHNRRNTNTITIDFYLNDDPSNIFTTSFSTINIQENFFSGVKIPKPIQQRSKEICFEIYSIDGTGLNTESIIMNSDTDEPIYRVYASALDTFAKYLWNILLKIIISNY